MPQTDASYSSSSAPLTRYVEHPGRRRAWRAGRRNLAWGVAFLVAALLVFAMAFYVGGPQTILPPLFFLASFTVLWVLARMKIFGQRNGVFFAMAVIALLGASAALLQQAWIRLIAQQLPGGTQPTVTLFPTTPVAPAVPQIPLLTSAPKFEKPVGSLPRVRAARDLIARIGDKTFQIQKGDVFQMSDEKGGEFVITAGEFLTRVPVDAMEQLAPEAASKEAGVQEKNNADQSARDKVTQRAQQEAMRRFPGLKRSGSAENKTFLEAYNDLKERKSDVLDDPEWPLALAEILAQRFKWQESGVVEDEPEVVEPSIAPGTKMLADPTVAPEQAPLFEQPKEEPNLMPEEPAIPPPPKGPSPE